MRRAGCLLLLLAGGASLAQAPGSPWDPLVAAAGLSPAEARLDAGRWRGGGKHALAAFDRAWDDWTAGARWAEGLGHDVRRDLARDSGRLERVTRRIGEALAGEALAGAALAGAALAGDALAGAATPGAATPGAATPGAAAPGASDGDGLDGRGALALALERLHAALGQPLDEAAAASLRRALAAAPHDTCRVAAEVVAVVPEVLAHQRVAYGVSVLPDAFVAGVAPLGSRAPWGEHPPGARRLATDLAQMRLPDDAAAARLAGLDVAALARGAVALAAGLDRAVACARSATRSGAEFLVTWDTPIGRVVLAGAQDDEHAGERTLLLVDAGGRDHHRAAASTAAGAVPVSVVLDLAGDDRYGQDRVASERAGRRDGAVAAGLLGHAALVDLAGNDRYEASRFSLGCGIAGSGLLADLDGDDRYEVQQHGAGAATAGLGLLIDLRGDDVHHGTTEVQGYAGPRGVGALVDGAGADEYVAQDDLVSNPSPQTAHHNTSLAQGCGFGRRADPGDGRSVAGGIGLLIDVAGDDRYRGGVFAQGVGYWYALGALVDLAGDDDFQAVWYGQGASAHYAVGVLIDGGGDDLHTVSMHQGIAAGHDFGSGVVIDRGGADRWSCAGGGVGAGIWNGIGAFADLGEGDDVYVVGPDGTLGHAGDSRPDGRALGLFLDDGGADRFPEHARARRDSTWLHRVAPTWVSAGRHGVR